MGAIQALWARIRTVGVNLRLKPPKNGNLPVFLTGFLPDLYREPPLGLGKKINKQPFCIFNRKKKFNFFKFFGLVLKAFISSIKI